MKKPWLAGGFANISLDRFLVCRGDPRDCQTLRWAQPTADHLSCYGLQVEAEPLYQVRRRVRLPTEAGERDVPANTQLSGGKRDFQLCPSSQGDEATDYQCRHNLIYWRYRITSDWGGGSFYGAGTAGLSL